MSKKSSVRLLFWMFILFLSSAIISLAIPRISARNAYAWGEEISTVEPDSKWLTKEYRDVYQLMPNQNFTYKFAYNAYSGYPLSNAFDGNFNSVFISQRAISSNTDVYIDIDFNRNATIDRIVYKSMSYNGVASGFPTNLKVWYGVGSYTSNSVTFETYSPTSDIVVFKFSQPITANKLRFQFVDITVVNNSLSGTLAVPSAAEIMFFQPEHSSVDIVSDLFTDYRWTELNPEYAKSEIIALLREELSGYANYQTAYQPRIDRAEAILNGTAGYIKGREFATDDIDLKKITQYGNIINYARSTLKMDYAGTHKQPTGIYQNAGQTITVWVDARDGVPLPGIDVAQYLNYCYNYQKSYSLSRGRNVITIPDFVNANPGFTYNRFTVSGGAIYITNPYTPNQQPGGVKVYIEGGYEFPLMTYDTAVEEYRAKLAEYSVLVKSSPNDYADVTELVANHAILTIPASSANNAYVTRDPREVLKTWDTMIEDILTFEGVALVPGGYRYDERVHHLNLNARYAQPMGNYAAYAFPEIIGLVDFLPSVVQSTTFGWGVPHEVGHLFDLSDRRLSETTNNVIAKYYETTHGTGNHGSFDMIRNTLTSDLADTTDFWSGHKGCFDFWWEIESVIPGYWAKFENNYRYEDRKGLTNTELMAYFSSLATGIDMSYYFERWGYFFGSDKPFKYANTSEKFKNVMAQAKEENKFTDTKQYKIWYANNNTYNYVANGGAGLYTDADKPSISSVVKVGGGYKIILPKSTNSAHYGYEILQGDETNGYKVIGFTESDSYIDATSYADGYVPSYKIVAYDKTLKHSATSEAASAETDVSNPVCRIGENKYSSLQLAMYAAKAGDIIYLLDDTWELDITVAVNVTITIADEVTRDIIIAKSGNGTLLAVNRGVTLTLTGNNNHKLILDGAMSHSGPLLYVDGATLKASYVNFINCQSDSAGGAISAVGGNLNLTNCSFNNCTASSGGAIYASSCVTTITSCKFENCSAQASGAADADAFGGAIYLADCENKAVNISSTTITGCSAQESGEYSKSNGGAIYIENCKNVIIDGTTIFDCEATYGGAIYIKNATVTMRNSCSVSTCSATDGGAIYATDVSTLAIVAATLTGNTASNNGGGIYVASADSSLSVTDLSILTSNTATYGGAIASVGTITNVEGKGSTYTTVLMMTANQAQFGGAIAVLNGGRIDSIQNIWIRDNTAEYGGAIYLEGSANIYDSATLGNNKASNMGGAIYYRGDANSQLKFNSFGPGAGSRPSLASNQAAIGYELYMESGNLVMLSVIFNYNYASANSAPTDEEMKYSLYVNSGNVTIAGYAGKREDKASYIEASLAREIYLSQNATIQLTGGMFAISPTYLPTNPPVLGQYITEQFLRIASDRYDFYCVKVLFTADFDIPANALDMISLKNTEYGELAIRGKTICFVPYEVTLTIDFGGETDTISRLVGMGSTYTFTAEGYQSERRYIVGFLVNGVTYKLGESITIDDATYIKAIIADKCKITLTFGGNEVIFYLIPGETYTFEDTCSLVGEEKVEFWLYNGKRYEIGDTVEITEDAIIMPVLEGMVKVAFYVDDEQVELTYVMVQDKLILPDLPNLNEGYEVYWLAGEERYKAGEEVTITGEVSFVAEMVKLKLTVSYYSQEELIKSITVEYGDEIVLKNFFELAEGYVLLGWTIDGTDYGADKVITVTENLKVVARVEKMKFTVSYYNQGELLSSISVEYGDEITLLSSIELGEGYSLVGWQVGEKLYGKGEKVTVTSDMTFDAVTEYVKPADPNVPTEPSTPTPDDTQDDDKKKKKGCRSVITEAPAIVGGLLVVAAAVIISKKKSKK